MIEDDCADFACTSCGATMQSYDEFEEYQHADCGGLVVNRREWADDVRERARRARQSRQSENHDPGDEDRG